MKHAKHTKLIALVLTLAIMITGIGIGDTVTANTAVKSDQFVNGGSITMKPGDVKKLLVTDSNGTDVVSKYNWTVSNKNIVSLYSDFADDTKDLMECLEIAANKTGTVTINGTAIYTSTSPYRISMTITVKSAKMTAKQKKCKHVFKTTKKATCQREGVKTCKKCKYQKTITKTSHKYKKTYVESTTYEYLRTRRTCGLCYDDGIETYIWTDNVPYHDDMQLTGDNADPYYTEKYEEMVERFNQHCMDVHDGWGTNCWSEGDEFYNPTKVTKTVTKCQYCHKEK